MTILHLFSTLQVTSSFPAGIPVKSIKLTNIFRSTLDSFYGASILEVINTFFVFIQALWVLIFNASNPSYLLTCEAERPYFRFLSKFFFLFPATKLIICLSGHSETLSSLDYLPFSRIHAILGMNFPSDSKSQIYSSFFTRTLYPRFLNYLSQCDQLERSINLFSSPTYQISPVSSITIISQYRDYLRYNNSTLCGYQKELSYAIFRSLPVLIRSLKELDLPIFYIPAYKNIHSPAACNEAAFFRSLSCNLVPTEVSSSPYSLVDYSSLYISVNSTLSYEFASLGCLSTILGLPQWTGHFSTIESVTTPQLPTRITSSKDIIPLISEYRITSKSVHSNLLLLAQLKSNFTEFIQFL